MFFEQESNKWSRSSLHGWYASGVRHDGKCRRTPDSGSRGSVFQRVDRGSVQKIAKEAEGARWGYTELGICNVEENNLNVRQEPDENGKLVGKLPKEAACEILKEEGDWTYIKSGKVEGYVKAEYLLSGYQAEKKAKETAKTVAVSSADALNIREELIQQRKW